MQQTVYLTTRNSIQEIESSNEVFPEMKLLGKDCHTAHHSINPFPCLESVTVLNVTVLLALTDL